MVLVNKYIEKPVSGSRPEGGVSEYTNGVLSLGGEHIDEESGVITTEKPKYVPNEYYNENSNDHVKSGDILVCKDGAKTGKCAYYDGDDDQNYCINEHIFLIRSKNETKVRQKFIFYFMISTFFQRQVQKLAHNKKGQPGLNQQHFNKILFPLFDPNEQSKIVRKIEAQRDSAIGKGSLRNLVDRILSDAGVDSTE